MCFYFEAFPVSCFFFFLRDSTCPVPETLAEVGCLQWDIEWVGGSSGVGCGSHIPPETQITLQETPALQHTHCPTVIYKHTAVWDTHTLAEAHIKISAACSEPVLHLIPSLTLSFPFLPSCLSCHSQSRSSELRIRFSLSDADHNEDKRLQRDDITLRSEKVIVIYPDIVDASVKSSKSIMILWMQNYIWTSHIKSLLCDWLWSWQRGNVAQ